jgi:hypothetical protein
MVWFSVVCSTYCCNPVVCSNSFRVFGRVFEPCRSLVVCSTTLQFWSCVRPVATVRSCVRPGSVFGQEFDPCGNLVVRPCYSFGRVFDLLLQSGRVFDLVRFLVVSSTLAELWSCVRPGSVFGRVFDHVTVSVVCLLTLQFRHTCPIHTTRIGS